MRKAANVAVNNYARLETDCKKQWNFHNSFFFAGTLATTIGTFLLPISTDKLHSRYQDQRDGEDRLKNKKDTAITHLRHESVACSVVFSSSLDYLILLIWFQ